MQTYSPTRWVLLSALILATAASVSRSKVEAVAIKGVVVRRIESCDYYMVQNGRDDYAILEWYGGHDPDKGDVLLRNTRPYGMKTLLDETADATTRVWVEAYSLTKEDALERLLDSCE